jgi:hypothetical protein
MNRGRSWCYQRCMSQGLEHARILAQGAQGRYAALKAEVEASVVRWQWATSVAHSYKPAYFELGKTVKGKPLPAEPLPPIGGTHGYGFDAEDRVVVERQQARFPGRYYETFFVHEARGIASFHFSYDEPRRWINVEWLATDAAGDVAELHAVYARGNAISTIYERDERGRVVRARRSGDNPPYGALDDWRELEYDEAGQLVRVFWCQPDGRKSLDFERASQAHSLPARWQELLEGLTAATLQALRDAPPPGAPDDPLYTIAFFHTGAEYQHRLPPNVAAGRLSTCARLQREHGDQAPEFLWSPAEWGDEDGLGGDLELPLAPELAALCASVNQDIWQNERTADADRFLLELAAALTAAQLPCPRAEGFCAISIALDRGEYGRQVEAQLTAEQARTLRELGRL